MSNLEIRNVPLENAKLINWDTKHISLKRDGTLIYYIDGKLFSPRCERTQRFKHIANALKNANFPNCMGEMYIDKPNANVFDVSRKENWDKAKFMPFDLIESDNYKEIYDMPLNERLELLFSLVVELDNENITEMITFDTFKEGWDYVEKNNCEGLVIRDNHTWFKVKKLNEDKIEIVEHEAGKDKGTFILKNGSRISGTSQQFVMKYLGIKKREQKAIAEIEYPFKTKEGKYFQPRLRQIKEQNE